MQHSSQMMDIKLANKETIEPTTHFYVILANSLVAVPCGAQDSDKLQVIATTEEAGFDS